MRVSNFIIKNFKEKHQIQDDQPESLDYAEELYKLMTKRKSLKLQSHNHPCSKIKLLTIIRRK